MKNLSLSKSITSIGVLVFLGVSFFFFNVVGNKFLQGVGIDFTEHKLYSISPASKQILAGLQEPVVLRLYMSKKLAKTYPYLLHYSARVEELLKNYWKNNKRKISLEIVELGPFSGMETQAVYDGVLGIPVDGTTEELFFGLVVKANNKKEIIPFIEPSKESTLEHSISSLIYQVAELEQDKYAPLLQKIQQRAEYSRPFVKLTEIQLFAQAKYQVRADMLNQKLAQLNAKMVEINAKKSNSSAEVQKQIAKDEEVVKLDLIVTKLELVELKKELSSDTSELERNIKFVAIGFMPLLILFFMLITWFYQSRIVSKHSSSWQRVLTQYN